MNRLLTTLFAASVFGGLLWLGAGTGTYRAPGTTATERAIEFVRTAAAGAAASNDRTSAAFRFYAGLSAMNYVQTILSSARYAMAQNESGFTPPSDIELCLVEGIGICGHHIKAFVEIMAGLGIPAREVEIYYADEHGERFSHIVAEIEWDGAWHMFDVTWGSCLMMAIR